MTAKFWNGASQVDIGTRKFWNGSTWVNIGLSKYWNGSAWVDISYAGGGGGGALVATVSDTTVFGSTVLVQPPAQPSVIAVGSDNPGSVTVSAAFGTAPYSYAWRHVSGDSAVQVLSPLAATTAFVANIGKNQSKTAVKACDVTDSLGAVATVFVTVTLQYTLERG